MTGAKRLDPAENGAAGPLHVADVIVVAFGVILAIAWIGPALADPSAWSYVLRNLGVISLYVVLYRIRIPSLAAAAWLRFALISVIAPFNYFQTGELIEALQPTSVPQIEAFLFATDGVLMGGRFHEWIVGIRTPIVTEILQLCYAAYFFLPLLLLVILTVRRKMPRVPEIYLAFVFTLLASYLGYLLVPARSPAFLHEWLAPDDGIWIAGKLWVYLRELGQGAHDAFPSGHTAVSLLVIYYAAKYDRFAFFVLGPVAGALIVSTVYMQYHYLLDVYAGILLAGFAIWFAGRIVVRTRVTAH